MPLPRSLSEILAAHADATKNDIRKVILATVTAVHPDRQTVDVQVAINNPLFDDLGNVYTEPAPSLSDVPLGILRGGGYMIWVPVNPGDSVLIMFSDLSTDTWRAGDGTAQDPGWVGKHTYDSPFAVPMFAPNAKFFTDPNNDPTKLIIGKDGSSAQIKMSATAIELGSAVNDNVALASILDTAVGHIVAAINGHIHTGGTLSGSTGPAAAALATTTTPIFGPTAIYPVPPLCGSTIIKAQ